MAEIKLENLTKCFGDVVAIDNINLEVKNHEFMIILGPTGAGKTTTLRCIAGLEKPDEGKVYINGQLVNDFTPAQRDVAFVFQEHILYPHLTVYENLAFPLKPRRMSKEEIDKIVKVVAETLHIEHLLERKPNTLSGGETQRVGLGRAMVRKPRLFLMDEPLTNLDAKLRSEMRAELKWRHRELSITTLYVTHDQVEAMSMGDRVAVLNNGVIQQIGSPMDIYNRPVNIFVAGFVGNPKMNLLNCNFEKSPRPPLIKGEKKDTVIKGEKKDTAFLKLEFTNISIDISNHQKQKIKENAIGRELVFGIRVEDISVQKIEAPEFVQTEVYVIEPLGAYNIIDLSIGKNPDTGKNIILKAKTPPTFRPEIGEKVWMGFNRERIHVFDRTTGKMIT
ncbi:ABC transporter ATP-binding protein [Candidatus Poribacteria bacterium]|nr:ABC transporter ATP-binding protein [Candidatus Poribacteria bacterium]